MMSPLRWQKRMLPLTMVVIAILFADKAVGLARQAIAGDVPPGASFAGSPNASSQIPTTSIVKAAPATGPGPSQSELMLLQDLRKRREALDERERQINQRADVLQAAETKLDQKLEDLASLQKNIKEQQRSKSAQGDAGWVGLVKMYEDMKPKDAAAIFNVLDMPVLLEVLDRMDDRKASAVMAAMLPERARSATQMLARRRVQADEGPTDAPPLEQHS